MSNIKNGLEKYLSWFSRQKADYLRKSPREKWLSVRNFNAYLLKLIGVDFMEENYKLSLRTLIPVYLELNYFGLLIYTLFYYRNEPSRALQSTPASGIFLPCLVLLIIIIKPSTRKQYRRMYNFAGDYIYRNSRISKKNNYVCNEMAIYLVTSSFKVNTLLLFSLTLITSAPIYKTFFTDEAEMVMPIILPFVDPDTKNGFYINVASQLFSCGWGAIVIPASELMTCVLKNTVSVTAAVIQNTLEDFKNQLEVDANFTIERTWQFRNIILKIRDFDRFVVDLTELYYWKFFLQPIILMYSVTISIYLWLMDNWSPGAGCAACCYIQLLILCDVGKTVDDANNAIEGALNQFPFYLLPLKKQEMFRLVLSRAQTAAKIRMGPFSELNYDTATNLTKMIYRYLMLILRTE